MVEVAIIKNLAGQIFDANENRGNASLRKHMQHAGWTHLQKLGFPQKSEEAWRYLNIKPILQREWSWFHDKERLVMSGHEQKITEALRNLRIENSLRLVFVNGVLDVDRSPDLAEIQGSGISIQSLGDWKENASHYSLEEVETSVDGFSLLNDICFDRQIELEVSKDVTLSKVLHFVFLTSGISGVMLHPRLRCQLKTGARISAIVQWISLDDLAEEFVNFSDSWRVADSAQLRLVHLQTLNRFSYSIGKTELKVAERANLDSLAISLGSKLSRHQLDCNICGGGANVRMNGLYLAQGEQTSDFHTLIHHQVGGSKSSQLYKGVLKDRGIGIFNGKVRIDSGAQEAESAQLNKNLLLSPNAEANSKPEMDIQADNVVATHGATFGRLSEDELFYLQSRAINKNAAMTMMMTGFSNEVLLALQDLNLVHYLEEKVKSFYGKG